MLIFGEFVCTWLAVEPCWFCCSWDCKFAKLGICPKPDCDRPQHNAPARAVRRTTALRSLRRIDPPCGFEPADTTPARQIFLCTRVSYAGARANNAAALKAGFREKFR